MHVHGVTKSVAAVVLAGCLLLAGGQGAALEATGGAAGPKAKSPAAVKAEAEFVRALAAAEKAYAAEAARAQDALVKELEKAMDAATKAGDLDEAVALRERARGLKAAAPGGPKGRAALGRDRLAREVADAVWVGSPNWGKLQLKSDGSFASEKAPAGTCGPVAEDMVVLVFPDGNTDVLRFDRGRRSVKAHHVGRIDAAAWEARREKGR